MTDPSIDDLAGEVAAAAQEQGFSLAVAESLTGGLLSNAFARAEGSSDWFRGGVVAYASEVKFDVLGVRPGPVVAETAAEQMADGVAAHLGADVGVAVTGVGGPDEQDGEPPGTVWVGVRTAEGTTTHLHRFPFDGDPGEVCDATTRAALEHLLARLR